MPRKRSEAFGVTGPSQARMKALAAVSKDFKEWRPAREALERVRSVRTIFAQLNAATRVNGWPIQRIGVIHGPSNNGKTAIAHGLGLSFLQAGHYYAYVDAEMTTPIDWVQELMGDMADAPGFKAMRPKSYEATVDAVRQFVETISKAKLAGKLPDDVSALIVVDSLRKLVPKRLMDKIMKEGAAKEDKRGKSKGGVDGLGGRAAQYKAALNAAWLDELVPLMAHSNASMLFIGREAENDDPFSEDWKLTGGKALRYDSSLLCRVERSAWVKAGEQVVGERLRVRIHKTKIGGKDDRVTDCFIHLSNGKLVPPGFDRARDLFEMGCEVGCITQSGSWFTSTDTGERWQGESAAVKALTADPASLARMEAEIGRRLAR